MADEDLPDSSSSNGAAGNRTDLPPDLDFTRAQAWLRDRYADDPAQQQISLDALDRDYTGAKVAAGTQKVLAQSRLDTAIDQFGANLRDGIGTPEQGQALIDRITGHPAFAAAPEARYDALQALRNHADALAAGMPPQGLGPRFTDALTASANDMPIAKEAQLKMLAQGELTPDGFATLGDVTADPIEAKLLHARLMSARARFVSGPDDAEGQAIFDDHFLPTFFRLYQMDRGQGKQPLDVLNPTGKDDLAARLVPIFAGMRAPAPASATQAGSPAVTDSVSPPATQNAGTATGSSTVSDGIATAPRDKVPATPSLSASDANDLRRVDGLPIQPGSDALPYFNASIAGKVKTFLDDLRGAGIPVQMTSGFRTNAKQATLKDNPFGGVAAGHSLHEAGYAFDVNWGTLTPDQQTVMLEEAHKQGFAWGGDFHHHRDIIHFQLDPFKDVAARRAYIPTAQRQYHDLTTPKAAQ